MPNAKQVSRLRGKEMNYSGERGMVIWLLAITWLFLTVVDMTISYWGIQAGATEVGLLYRFSDSFFLMSAVKIALALIVALLLVFYNRAKWLMWLNWGMIAIVIWNCLTLGKQL